MKIAGLMSLAINGLLVSGMSMADAPKPQLQTIVIGGDQIGGDQAELREISSCEKDFGQDALGDWISQVVHPLCKQGDAESLFEVFLITAPGIGGRGGLVGNAGSCLCFG